MSNDPSDPTSGLRGGDVTRRSMEEAAGAVEAVSRRVSAGAGGGAGGGFLGGGRSGGGAAGLAPGARRAGVGLHEPPPTLAELEDQARRRIRERPLQCAALAFAAGFVIAILRRP